MDNFFKPDQVLTLFPMANIGIARKQRQPSGRINGVHVDKEIAKKRYYFIRRLKEIYHYQINTAKRELVVPYESLRAMPKGDERYYVFMLIKLGFTYQFTINIPPPR